MHSTSRLVINWLDPPLHRSLVNQQGVNLHRNVAEIDPCTITSSLSHLVSTRLGRSVNLVPTNDEDVLSLITPYRLLQEEDPVQPASVLVAPAVPKQLIPEEVEAVKEDSIIHPSTPLPVLDSPAAAFDWKKSVGRSVAAVCALIFI